MTKSKEVNIGKPNLLGLLEILVERLKVGGFGGALPKEAWGGFGGGGVIRCSCPSRERLRLMGINIGHRGWK